jgi:ACS family sodium-dependent inorganic phosphate cotransporter
VLLQGWIGFTLLSEMPSYLTDILGFDLGSAGILCVFPYAALFMSTLAFARGFDYLQRECDWQVDRVRKTAMFISFMGSATGLLICGFLPDKYAAYTFMILTQVR